MHLFGRPDDDAQGCEGMGPGAPELACPRRIVRVGRPPEDEHLEAGGVHAVEQLPSPFLAEPGEVDTAALFESHDPGHTATPVTLPSATPVTLPPRTGRSDPR